MVACNNLNQGCNGGILALAWKYLTNTGIVTDTCDPYTSSSGTSPKCLTSCSDGESWSKYKCQAGSVVQATTPAQIKSEVSANGPMETGFIVYEDFMNYESGVYHYTTGKELGGHAVKIVGYGVTDDGTNYWICANSWGPDWGESGFFRIQEGDCNIDQSVFACSPLV